MNNIKLKPEHFMKEALKEAEKAKLSDEVPVGAVVVHSDKIIARGYNQVETLNDATAHAEILAITSAMSFTGAKYLNECDLYVSLEPCVMCAGAAHLSKLKSITFGAYDPTQGFTIKTKGLLPKKVKVVGGLMEEECSIIINAFFQDKR
jgi:tRNA(adenine34) deaminase